MNTPVQNITSFFRDGFLFSSTILRNVIEEENPIQFHQAYIKTRLKPS